MWMRVEELRTRCRDKNFFRVITPILQFFENRNNIHVYQRIKNVFISFF